MTDTSLKKLEFQQESLKKTKNLDIVRLQMVLQGRRVIGFSKIEFVVKVQDLILLISCKH